MDISLLESWTPRNSEKGQGVFEECFPRKNRPGREAVGVPTGNSWVATPGGRTVDGCPGRWMEEDR